MTFLEYERAKIKYYEAQEWFEQALSEQERLMTKTMPSAIRYDKANVKSSPNGNVLDDYVIAKEEKRIDKKISRMRKLLEDREKILSLKENELRKSHDNMDMIYLYWKIDGFSPNEIAKALNYSKSQVYRMIGNIKSLIKKDATKCEK